MSKYEISYPNPNLKPNSLVFEDLFGVTVILTEYGTSLLRYTTFPQSPLGISSSGAHTVYESPKRRLYRFPKNP